MRLTLRTLLAWLDDTLEPSQVRDIGKQVAESPFAQELADRIHRVTRQRRLSVPSRSGPEATDPNIVASYLDNDLDADAVAEFEKKCLTSDVNLAEVASVHQILSLLGQKVQVPPEARNRMYQLVRGRETVATKPVETRRPSAPQPLTQPIAPWIAPEPPKRTWMEQYGLALACALLIMVCIFTAWRSLIVPPATVVGIPPSAESVPSIVAERSQAPVIEISPEPESTKANSAVGSGAPEKTTPPTETVAADTSKGAQASMEAKSKAVAAPSGFSGMAEKSSGILLRYNTDKREWERLTEATPLNRSDRLLCLTPFRASITLGKIRITLVGETEVRILSGSTDAVPALELVQGRFVVRQPAADTLRVVFSNRSVSLGLTSDNTVALERIEPRMYGQPVMRTQPIAICAIQGDLNYTIDNKQDELKDADVVLIDAGQPRIVTPEKLPPWAVQLEPTPYEQQVGGQFLQMFHPGRPILAELVAAVEDERKEIKDMAVHAIKALGDLSLLMPLLSRDDDPAARRFTIDAIRSYMAAGVDAANRVRTQLDREFDDKLGASAQQMLIGYSPEDLAKGDVYQRLVSLMSPDQPKVGIRELALDSLRRITGRDDLGYDPDHPQGKGFDAWNDLLRRNELKPLRPAKAQ